MAGERPTNEPVFLHDLADARAAEGIGDPQPEAATSARDGDGASTLCNPFASAPDDRGEGDPADSAASPRGEWAHEAGWVLRGAAGLALSFSVGAVRALCQLPLSRRRRRGRFPALAALAAAASAILAIVLLSRGGEEPRQETARSDSDPRSLGWGAGATAEAPKPDARKIAIGEADPTRARRKRRVVPPPIRHRQDGARQGRRAVHNGRSKRPRPRPPRPSGVAPSAPSEQLPPPAARNSLPPVAPPPAPVQTAPVVTPPPAPAESAAPPAEEFTFEQ